MECLIKRTVYSEKPIRIEYHLPTKGKALTTPVMFGDVAGVEFSHVPQIGIFQVDEQDQRNIIVLKRNMQTGELDLLSIMKGSYFRAADFPSEANIALKCDML